MREGKRVCPVHRSFVKDLSLYQVMTLLLHLHRVTTGNVSRVDRPRSRCSYFGMTHELLQHTPSRRLGLSGGTVDSVEVFIVGPGRD